MASTPSANRSLARLKHLPVDLVKMDRSFVAHLTSDAQDAVLARLIRLLIHATPLSLPARLLGGGFGALRGGVLLLAVAAVVALTPAAQSAGWRSSKGARWLAQTLQALKPLLPDPAARWLHSPAASLQRA